MTRFMNRSWEEAARSIDETDLQNMILSGAVTEEMFVPDSVTVELCGKAVGLSPQQPMQILDFGCGLGRNILGIVRDTDWYVTGYDSHEMIQRAMQWLERKLTMLAVPCNQRCALSHHWEAIRVQQFDCVLATLVFQHIYEEELIGYLQDIQTMTRKLVVHGRRFNDDHFKNTWKIINRVWKPVTAPTDFVFEGDPEEHHTIVWEPRSTESQPIA